MLKNCTIVVFIGLFCLQSLYAQKKKKKQQVHSPQQELEYRDKNYLPMIQSVMFYNAELEQSLPLLQLNTNQQLALSFDDLRADYRRFYFSIEHCDVNWQKSQLSTLEYSAGYGEDPITETTASRNTITPYTHYEMRFPTENVRPLISGNYLLKVYEDGNKNRLILSRRFYVVDQKTTLKAKVVPSINVNTRKSHQQLNIQVNTQGLQINNPSLDIQVIAMQNKRSDIQLKENMPSIGINNELVYNRPSQFNFPGGQEFLYVDLRSMRLQSATVSSMETDSVVHVSLMQDHFLDNTRYSETPDENGNFYIQNQDYNGDDAITADYARVTFELKTDHSLQGGVYLLGGFNNFSRTPENEMHFDETDKSWKITKWLKQGVYDYTYAVGNTFQQAKGSAPGSDHFETGNNYEIFIYYRNPRLNRDELVGFSQLDSQSSTGLR